MIPQQIVERGEVKLSTSIDVGDDEAHLSTKYFCKLNTVVVEGLVVLRM